MGDKKGFSLQLRLNGGELFVKSAFFAAAQMHQKPARPLFKKKNLRKGNLFLRTAAVQDKGGPVFFFIRASSRISVSFFCETGFSK